MKIKLSKSQWQQIGKTAGWIKEAGKNCGRCGVLSPKTYRVKDESGVIIQEDLCLKCAEYAKSKIDAIKQGSKNAVKKTAGGWGHMSEDLSDCIEGQCLLLSRSGGDENAIFAKIKEDSVLNSMLQDEQISDQDLRQCISECLMLYNHSRTQ